jgi:serine/threonine protein kinase
MGEVYRAFDTRLERDIAIKILAEAYPMIRDRSSVSKTKPRRSRLCHISTFLPFSMQNSNIHRCFLLQFLEGETLRSQISRSAIPWRRAVEIACGAEGLAAAHHAGVIHRDLKPEHIFLTTRGAVKILDFALARLNPMLQDKSEIGVKTASEPGLLVGSIGYRACLNRSSLLFGLPILPVTPVSIPCPFCEAKPGKETSAGSQQFMFCESRLPPEWTLKISPSVSDVLETPVLVRYGTSLLVFRGGKIGT